MKNFTKNCYRSCIVALLSLIALPTVLSNKANAEDLYEQQTPFSEAELAQILAPIALYPDSLLTHILIASTYPLEIVQANRWRTKNSHFDANQAIKRAADKNWDPSVSALLAFPNLLARLSNDLVWTQNLGTAFLQDEAAVLASIQSLRQQADQANSLSELENMSVIHIDNQIIIESAHNGIIYVPYYDPRIVYGHWHWYGYPPVYWAPSPYYKRRSHAYFYWGSGVQISFNYYFSTFNWHKRNVIVVNHHNSQTYRPRGRIITSNGAHRWQHKAQPYSRAHLKRSDGQRYPSRVQSKNVQSKRRDQLFDKKINQQENKRQQRDNKSNPNKLRSSSQLEQQLKQPASQRKSEQAINNRVNINQQENRRQFIDKKNNQQENRRQLIDKKKHQQENRRQQRDNKSNPNKLRSNSQLEQQLKQPARQRKSEQAINNRVNINQQENRRQLSDNKTTQRENRRQIIDEKNNQQEYRRQQRDIKTKQRENRRQPKTQESAER
ncbi:MAG: hypothetical protein ACJAU1_001171 [Psychromonas sp.]|jgi:hypothetical protein